MPNIISSGAMTAVRARVADAIHSPALMTAVTYVAVSAVSFVAGTGARTRTKVETAVNALVFPIALREIMAAEDRYKVGDMVVNIAVGDISEPSEADKVKIGSTEHHIVSWAKDSASSKYRLVCRKV